MKPLDIEEYILLNYGTKTNEQMARECNCSTSTISNYRKKLGISQPDLIKKLRNKTDYICDQKGRKTSSELAAELECSVSFIHKIWRENNLSLDGRIYSCNDNYFSNIDTAQKAYFLGLIASDGCVYQREGHQDLLSLSLQKEDEEILEIFRQELDTVKPISYQKNKKEHRATVGTLQITSKQLCSDLIAIGIRPRKTFDMSILDICSKIPTKFINSFILGYFDGDGSIYLPSEGISRANIVISAPIKNLVDFQKILDYFDIKTSVYEDKRSYSAPFGELDLTGTTTKYLFLKFIYYDAPHSLTRKKELSNSLMDRIECNVTNRSENIKAVNNYKSVVLKWGELLER